MKDHLNDFYTRYAHLLPVGILLLTVTVLFFTLFPSDFVGGGSLGRYDKVGHMVMFGSWTYLFGLYRTYRFPERASLFTIFLVGVGFGIAVELLQFALPFDRNPELFDIAFDAIGSFLAILLLKGTLDIE